MVRGEHPLNCCRLEACATIVFIAGKIPLKRGDYTLPAKFVFHSACFPQRILIKYPLTGFSYFLLHNNGKIARDVVTSNNAVLSASCTSCLMSIYYTFAPIAQLDRVTDYESGGWRFNSSWAHFLN